VNFNDLVAVAQNYNTTVAGATDNWWMRVDFNLDGDVNFNDLVLLAQNYNQSLPSGGLPASIAHDWSAAVAGSNVPEPAWTGVLGILAIAAGLARRRGTWSPVALS
jgi:hypothetical protein